MATDPVGLEHAVCEGEWLALMAPVQVAEMHRQRIGLARGPIQPLEPDEGHHGEMLAPAPDLGRRDNPHLNRFYPQVVEVERVSFHAVAPSASGNNSITRCHISAPRSSM